METCPCCSGVDFEACCGPYLNGDAKPPTAEALMRSRYTAYANGNIDYIRKTTHNSALPEFDEDAARKWSKESSWQGLEIISVTGGEEGDTEGEVEFVARYTQRDEEETHHEKAIFKKEGQRWFFVDGRMVGAGTYIRPVPKVGRNEPCSCGSGKKYKKCCGR